MVILAGGAVLVFFGVMAYFLEWKDRSHRERMDHRQEFMSRKNVGSVNGIPTGYMFTASFIITLLAIIGGLMKG